MRTRAEMRTRVQRWLADAGGDTYGNTAVEDMLEEAALAVWELAVAEPDHRRRRFLRKYSTWTALTAEQETYSQPADCLLVEAVQIRWADADIRWTDLPYREPPAGAVRSGTASILSSFGSPGAIIAWFDDVAERSVRIWPELQSVNEEKYRFCYFHIPTFPPAGGDTFNTQSAQTVNTLSEGVDALCEYYAAAVLAHEELEDRKPVGAFGNLFRARYDGFTRGQGAGRTRQRRRIRFP